MEYFVKTPCEKSENLGFSFVYKYNRKALEAVVDLHNAKRDSYTQPVWRWDCSWKLDFDGGKIVPISSRFYPPHKNGDGADYWEGDVSIWDGEESHTLKAFKNEDLEQLMLEAEAFADDLLARANPEVLKLVASLVKT